MQVMDDMGRMTSCGSAAKARMISAWLAIAALMTVNAYRATTQSFIGDESLTYFWFLQGSWLDIFTRYDANNHVLFSLLAKLSISVFGLHEAAFRIPSLAGGFLYLIAAQRLSDLMFRSNVAYFLSFGLLSLNPLVLDFLSCGRGYSLGLAGLCWGLLEQWRWFAGQKPRPGRMGAWLAAGTCANLTLLIPSASVLAVSAAFTWKEKKEVWAVLVAAAVFACICCVFLAAPLSLATRDHFYAGTQTVAESFRSLIGSYVPHAVDPVAAWAAAGLLLMAVLMAARNPRDPRSAPAAVLSLSLAALYLAHRLFQVPLPLNRTGLYLIPLFSLAAVAGWEMLPHSMAGRVFRTVATVILLAVLSLYVREFRTDHYAVWWYDSAAKAVAKQIEAWAKTRGYDRPVVVAATIWVYPPLALYGKISQGAFVATPVVEGCKATQTDFSIPAASGSAEKTALAEPDLYFVHNPDLRFLDACGLRKIAEYPKAISVLAVKKDAAVRQGGGAAASKEAQ